MARKKPDIDEDDDLTYSEQALRGIFYQLKSIHFVLDIMLALAALAVILSFIR